MSDEWAFYECQIDNGPASIFLDLGVRGELPFFGFEKLLSIRIYLKSPSEEGLTSSVEVQGLCDLEDDLEKLIDLVKLIYVGRITYNRKREYFFYCQDFLCKEALCEIFSKHQYRFDVAQMADPNWSGYLIELYPSQEDRQVINDRKYIDGLVKNGYDLGRVYKIGHSASFDDKGSAGLFVEKILNLNFELSSVDKMDDGMFKVGFCRVDKPELPQISSITVPLSRLARNFNGYYNGWGLSKSCEC